MFPDRTKLLFASAEAWKFMGSSGTEQIWPFSQDNSWAYFLHFNCVPGCYSVVFLFVVVVCGGGGEFKMLGNTVMMDSSTPDIEQSSSSQGYSEEPGAFRSSRAAHS